MIGAIELGMAGQLRVASELILRGHRPAITLVDKGVDLITEAGLRVQVKTSRLSTYRRYVFSFANWHKTEFHGLANVDFVVCWGVTTNEFWVFPAKVLTYRMLKLIPGSQGQGRRWDHPQYKEAWDLLDQLKE